MRRGQKGGRIGEALNNLLGQGIKEKVHFHWGGDPGKGGGRAGTWSCVAVGRGPSCRGGTGRHRWEVEGRNSSTQPTENFGDPQQGKQACCGIISGRKPLPKAPKPSYSPAPERKRLKCTE